VIFFNKKWRDTFKMPGFISVSYETASIMLLTHMGRNNAFFQFYFSNPDFLFNQLSLEHFQLRVV